jgi:hypothetical protein
LAAALLAASRRFEGNNSHRLARACLHCLVQPLSQVTWLEERRGPVALGRVPSRGAGATIANARSTAALTRYLLQCQVLPHQLLNLRIQRLGISRDMRRCRMCRPAPQTRGLNGYAWKGESRQRIPGRVAPLFESGLRFGSAESSRQLRRLCPGSDRKAQPLD